MVNCPECDANIHLSEVEKGELVECSECGLELEVTGINPLQLEKAPEEQEDWGE